jgi:predicted anti-sigma-YlaC factor YlaD
MKCSLVMEALLEADLEDLTRERDSELARHLMACDRCRAAADRILEGEGELAKLVGDARSHTPMETALRTAHHRARAQRRMVRARRVAVPLAAAASIAAVVLFRGRAPDTAPIPMAQPVAFDLGVSPDRNVVVFESEARPNIVVVWFY